jgi:hypothetical protein
MTIAQNLKFELNSNALIGGEKKRKKIDDFFCENLL